jgi:ribosomal protection tetracycline resistance protein
LGILAHVDAGKTTLTERLLFAAGVIDELGSVDAGTTQTDSLALERRRGITIKAAVVSFAIGDVTVNLIDTPGHPDFIAEVDRVLGVLDGAVLVVSAVEGVQAQTRVLTRALQRLRVPTLVFVNKIDRSGADDRRVLDAIAERLTPALVPLGSARDLGQRDAAFVPHRDDDRNHSERLAARLAEHDDELLHQLVEHPETVEYADLLARLRVQTAHALVHPVLFGSAATGAGVDSLMVAIATLLPAGDAAADGPPAGSVFKIERGPAGEKIAYVRMFAGAVNVRDRLHVGDRTGRVTAIKVFESGAAVDRASVAAGQIGKLWGLKESRVGDAIGITNGAGAPPAFAPPTLETVVVPVDPRQKGRLHDALAQLAEQDPLIDLRQDDTRQEMFVSLYGEVQKEVIQESLAADFGVEVAFRDTTTICIERPAASGAAVEMLGGDGNPFLATVGLRVEPSPAGSGVRFALDVELTSIPLYVYKTVDEFAQSMEDYVRATFLQGLFGWQVTDCTVTMTDSGYTSPSTTAGDFRKLTPLVLMAALARAGTTVCEPIDCFHLEAPAAAITPVLRLLARLRAVPRAPVVHDSWLTLDGHVPAAESHLLQQQLRGLTHGEGTVEVEFGKYEPVAGGPLPTRARSDHNPLDRKEYLLHVLRRM